MTSWLKSDRLLFCPHSNSSKARPCCKISRAQDLARKSCEPCMALHEKPWHRSIAWIVHCNTVCNTWEQCHAICDSWFCHAIHARLTRFPCEVLGAAYFATRPRFTAITMRTKKQPVRFESTCHFFLTSLTFLSTPVTLLDTPQSGHTYLLEWYYLYCMLPLWRAKITSGCYFIESSDHNWMSHLSRHHFNAYSKRPCHLFVRAADQSCQIWMLPVKNWSAFKTDSPLKLIAL